MNNILITGISGFIGNNLAKFLSGKGYNIIGIHRHIPTTEDHQLLGLKNYTTCVGDITNYEFVDSVINKYEIDTVFHLAANAIVRTCQKSPIRAFESNIVGTYNILEACRQNQTVKAVVAMASDKFYGQTEILPYTEGMTPSPSSPYEVSKTCADFICRSFYKTYGLPVTVVRGANVFGARDFNMSRLIPNSCRLLSQNKPPKIWADVAEYEREFIYVGDMVSALVELAKNIEKTKGEAFNVGSGKAFKVKDVVERLCKVSKKDIKPEFPKKEIPFLEIPKQVLSIEKIKKTVDWEPSLTNNFDACLLETYQWYKNERS